MAAPRWEPTEDQLTVVDDPHLSRNAAAVKLGVSAGAVGRMRREREWEPADNLNPMPGGPLGTAGIVTSEGGDITVTSPPIRGGLAHVVDAEAYLRDRWSLPTDKYGMKPVLVNEWEANAGQGEVMTLGQVKGTFYPLASIAAILPKPAEWTGPRYRRAAGSRTGGEHQIVVTSDDQAPYHSEALHAATCMVLRDIQPRRVVKLGDGADYTNISKHKDHAVVKAAVDTCTQAYVDILVDERAAAPGADFDILAGNHDIRPLSELLLRAERMADIHIGMLPGETDRQKVLDLSRLWRLDELGIKLHEDARGWEHAEIDLVPGPRGLAAVHGYLTGKDVAKRTLERVGRSCLMGHTHGPESYSIWNPTIGFEMRAMVVGCQCEVRGGKLFPTFAPRDRWLQGGAIVTVHSDGEWVAERMRWNGESLFVGRNRYTP